MRAANGRPLESVLRLIASGAVESAPADRGRGERGSATRKVIASRISFGNNPLARATTGTTLAVVNPNVDHSFIRGVERGSVSWVLRIRRGVACLEGPLSETDPRRNWHSALVTTVGRKK